MRIEIMVIFEPLRKAKKDCDFSVMFTTENEIIRSSEGIYIGYQFDAESDTCYWVILCLFAESVYCVYLLNLFAESVY